MDSPLLPKADEQVLGMQPWGPEHLARPPRFREGRYRQLAIHPSRAAVGGTRAGPAAR